MMSRAIDADDPASFTREVLNSTVPVVVDFWAPWCGPCRAVAPELEALAEKYQGHLRVVKVNIDNNQQAAIDYRVMSIPLIGLFRDGQMVASSLGAKPGHAIEHDLGLDRLPPRAPRGVTEINAAPVTRRPDGTY
jgi:thioredoxin 1